MRVRNCGATDCFRSRFLGLLGRLLVLLPIALLPGCCLVMNRVSMLKDHITPPVLVSDTPQSILVTLNRPKVLNALSQDSLSELHSAVSQLSSRTLILTGAGKAFCAGGDVIHLCSHPEDCPGFFRSEFSLLYRIHSRASPSIAVMKGPTMGGGSGLSAACKARVATNTTLWAFPETVIGFVPDVGANFLLPRLSSRAVGLFLALTGERLNGADCFYLGIATHYVDENRLEEMVRALAVSADPMAALSEFHQAPDRSLCCLTPHVSQIDEVFSNVTTMEEVMARLSTKDSEWARKTLATLNFMCPLSLKVELRLFELGSTMTYGQVLDQEYDVCVRMTSVNNANFLTGVRHRLIQKEKTRAPWSPASLTEVTEEMVLSCLNNEAGPRLHSAQIRE